MILRSFSLLAALTALSLRGVGSIFAASPDIVWESPTPNGLANSIVGVGWSPKGEQVAVGSTDRWLRTRQADAGEIIYSILGPQHGRGGDQTIYSRDGIYLAVHNQNKGLDYRVYRAVDGVFLGMITVTFDANNLVHFAPDSQLLGSAGGDGTMSLWRFEEFTVVFNTGSGYHVTTTTFNFSPNGAYQSSASIGEIIIQSRTDGSKLASFAGGAVHGFTPISFTPDSNAIAAWDGDSNQTTLWRIPGLKVLRLFPDAVPAEGIGSIRFTPNGMHLVTTGYLPFQDSGGLWQQYGVVRFWRVSDGALVQQFDSHTGIGVTSRVDWSPDGSQFIYGTYEGTTVVAQTPALKSLR